MAAGRIVLSQYFPARDRNARLVSGALLYVYTNGTTTKASIYSDEALATPLANPVAANSSGQFPAIWASDAVTYTLSITSADGESIGNPSVFDNYSVSTDADTAAVALAEAAAVSAAADLADMLAVVATGDDAAAIAARAAKAANLSDLADVAEARTNIGADLADNVNYTSATAVPATRSVQAKQREQPVSPLDSAEATDTLRLIDAMRSAQNGAGGNVARIPAGAYSVDLDPLDISEEMRGKPLVVRGAGTGEPFVSAALQEGTRLLGSSSTVPTLTLKHRNTMSGAGSIDFGHFYIRGTKDTLVPVVSVEGLQGINRIHELGIVQLGLGDGVHMGNLTTSTFDNNHILGATWASSGSGVARTGTGFKLELDQDNGLGLLHKITSRGWSLAYQFGGATGLRPLGYRASLCESSVCTNGFNIGAVCEGFHLDQPYVEATYGYAIKDEGEATLITNPYIVLDFTTGIEFRGTGGTVVGGYIGLPTTGGKGIVIGATSGGASVFGTQFIWGGGSSGTNVGHGIHIEAQANPVVNLFPDYRGNWTGTGTSARLLDESYSSVHGGSGGGIGYGSVGFLYRRSQGLEPLPCLSRGAINLRVDGTSLSAPHINGSGTLTVSNASVQYLALSASTTAIVRFSAPNLPDKTGKLLINAGYARFNPSIYILGITMPVIFDANERAVVEYQCVPGVNGVVWITNIHRTKPWAYTVAELLTGNAGAPWPGQPHQIIASNGRKAAEGAGAGTGCPVWHDGTTWRTMYDNTIVAA